ncbi:hypothetical protein AGMMS49957_18600 [Synergistales bacterium]|nr:hypothetical protein AGMMS49957_18600 [Synergistales bacterium]
MSWGAFRISAEKRVDSPRWLGAFVTLLSLAGALLAGAAFLFFQGVSPLACYGVIFDSAFGSLYDLSETGVKALPVAIVSLAVMLCFTMLVWNIGAEGQALIGALAAAAVVRYFPLENKLAMLSLMFVAAALFGGAWATNIKDSMASLVSNGK